MLIVLIFFIHTAVANSTDCPLIETDQNTPMMDGQLSPLWAQHMMGADLAREEIESNKNKTTVKAAILDLGFELSEINGPLSSRIEKQKSQTSKNLKPIWKNLHGSFMANLANGLAPYGVSPTIEWQYLGWISDFDDILDYSETYSQAYQPKLLHLSIGYEGSESSSKNLAQLLNQSKPQNKVIVASAGDFYPKELSVFKKNLNAILIGSVDPDGKVSSFSQRGEKVIIHAPGGKWLKAKRNPGHIEGTSGPAALVSGAIGNVLSLIPDLTQEEVLTLLKQTALKNSEGVLMINAYRLLLSVQNLIGFGGLNPQVRAALIHQSLIYDFKKQSQELLSVAEKNIESNQCEVKKQGFVQLRKAFLLSQTMPQAAQAIKKIYKEHGYEKDALFYDQF